MLYILVFTKPKLPVEQPVWATACMLYTRSIYARENDILLHVKRGKKMSSAHILRGPSINYVLFLGLGVLDGGGGGVIN